MDVHGMDKTVTGEWHSAQSVVQEHQITAQFNRDAADSLTDSVSILLSMGIEFGTAGYTNDIVAVKHAGCGRVLAIR